MAFALNSPAFRDGEKIPDKYTADGENLSPPLVWNDPPAGTKSFALVVEDPDAPSGTFRHWGLYNISAGRTMMPEGVEHGVKTEQLGHAVNDFGHRRYDGPAPPRGHGPHHYRFRLAALARPRLRPVDRSAPPHAGGSRSCRRLSALTSLTRGGSGLAPSVAFRSASSSMWRAKPISREAIMTKAVGRNERIDYRSGQHWIAFEPSPKRIRVMFNGKTVVDTLCAGLMREAGRMPVFYFPRPNVRTDLMERTDHVGRCPHRGDASYWTLRLGGRQSENAVWSYEHPSGEFAAIAGWLAFDGDKADHWFEEDEEVFGHARDPYHRVDVRPSSREVRVLLGGEMIARTRKALLLFETGLPTRYYIPPGDVRMELLDRSKSTSTCPYKGQASHWSARIGDRSSRTWPGAISSLCRNARGSRGMSVSIRSGSTGWRWRARRRPADSTPCFGALAPWRAAGRPRHRWFVTKSA